MGAWNSRPSQTIDNTRIKMVRGKPTYVLKRGREGFQNNPVDNLLAGISNESICNWFYFMYLLALFSALLQVGVMFFGFFKMKNKSQSLLLIAGALVGLGIMVTQSLFLYSLCNRALAE
jgi:hypothetical protein